MRSLSELPAEIIVRFAVCLDGDLLTLHRVSRHFHQVLRSPVVWAQWAKRRAANVDSGFHVYDALKWLVDRRCRDIKIYERAVVQPKCNPTVDPIAFYVETFEIIKTACQEGYAELVALLTGGAVGEEKEMDSASGKGEARERTTPARLKVSQPSQPKSTRRVEIEFERDYLRPFSIAVINGHVDCARILLRASGSFDLEKSNYTLAFKTLIRGLVDSVQFLIEHGHPLERPPEMSLLTVACSLGNEEMVRMLIAKGADVNFNHNDPIKAAKGNNHEAIVELLCSNGATVDGLPDYL